MTEQCRRCMPGFRHGDGALILRFVCGDFVCGIHVRGRMKKESVFSVPLSFGALKPLREITQGRSLDEEI